MPRLPANPQKWDPLKKMVFSRKVLFHLHRVERLTPGEIADRHEEITGVPIHRDTVICYLKKYDFHDPKVDEDRLQRQRERLSVASGKYMKYQPDHRLANDHGRVFLHILMAEEKWGIRYSSKRHRIRFKDGDPKNCKPSNLKLTFVRSRDAIDRDAGYWWHRTQMRDGRFGRIHTWYRDDDIPYRIKSFVLRKICEYMYKKIIRDKELTENEETYLVKALNRSMGGYYYPGSRRFPDRYYKSPLPDWAWVSVPVDWDRVRERAEELGVTSYDLAEAAGFVPESLRVYWNKDVGINRMKARRIARKLGLRMKEMTKK